MQTAITSDAESEIPVHVISGERRSPESPPSGMETITPTAHAYQPMVVHVNARRRLPASRALRSNVATTTGRYSAVSYTHLTLPTILRV